jgi:hypothetical protein
MGETLEMETKSDIRRWPFEIQSSNFRNLDVRKWRGFRRDRGTSVYKMDMIREKVSSKIGINCPIIRERFERNENIPMFVQKS